MKSKLYNILLLAVFLLSGCQAGPETQATLILRDQMKSPDSFVAKDTKIMWQGKDQKGNNAYVIQVVYTAQNSYGAYLQECKMVAFSISNKHLHYDKNGNFEDCGDEDNALLNPKYIAKLMSSRFSN